MKLNRLATSITLSATLLAVHCPQATPEPAPSTSPSPTASPTASPTPPTSSQTKDETVTDYIYLYYFDNPIRLIEAISQTKAVPIRKVTTTVEDPNTGSALALARNQLERFQQDLRSYNAAMAPLLAKKARITEEKNEIIRNELRPAADEEERAKTNLEEAKFRVESDPDNREALDLKRTRERELAEAGLKRVRVQGSIDDKNQSLTALDTEVSNLEAKIGQTRTSINTTTRNQISTAANAVIDADFAYQTALNKQVEQFAAERDAGELWTIKDSDGTRLIAAPDQRSILLVGTEEHVGKYRELVQKLDRPMSQSMVHLWTLQYSSHSDSGGNKSSQQALDQIDLALRKCRVESQTHVRDIFDAYSQAIAGCTHCVDPDPSGLLETAGFWTRVKIYDRECLAILGVNPSHLDPGSKVNLEEEYPLARLCIPDPGKVSNLSELLAVLVMSNDAFQASFREELRCSQEARWRATEAARRGSNSPAVTQKELDDYLRPFSVFWDSLDIFAADSNESNHQSPFRTDLAYNFREAADQLLLTALFQRMEYVVTAEAKIAKSNKPEPETTSFTQATVDIPVLQIKASYRKKMLEQAKTIDEKRKIYKDLEAIHEQLSAYRVKYPGAFQRPPKPPEKKPVPPPKWLLPEDELYVYFYSEVEPLRIEVRKRLAINELGDVFNGQNRLAKKLLADQSPKPTANKHSPSGPGPKLKTDLESNRIFQKLPKKNQEELKANAYDSPVNSKVYNNAVTQYNKAITDYRTLSSGLESLVPNTRRSPEQGQELLRSVSQLRRRTTVGGFGSSKEASTNMRMRQAMASLEDVMAKVAIEPCLQDLRRSLRDDCGLEVGIFERTSLLCSNRLVAQTEARASSRLEIGQQQDLLESLRLLGMLVADSQTGNALDAFNRLQDQREERRPELYAINTGGVFELTPVVDPTGQGMRFRVNHVVKSIIQDPDQSSRPELNRIEGQTINTEVALSNFDLQEVTRYRSNARLGIPEHRSGGLPIFRDIPVLKEVPLIGWFTRDFGEAAVTQQSLVLADSTVYPTLESILESLTPPYRNVLNFPKNYYDAPRLLPGERPQD